MGPFLPVNCCPATRTRQVGLQPSAVTDCVLVMLRLLVSFGVNAIDFALPGSRRIEWRNHAHSCCSMLLPPSLCSRYAGARRVDGQSPRSGGTGPITAVSRCAAASQGADLVRWPPDQRVNFATADTYVAEHAIIHARE